MCLENLMQMNKDGKMNSFPAFPLLPLSRVSLHSERTNRMQRSIDQYESRGWMIHHCPFVLEAL